MKNPAPSGTRPYYLTTPLYYVNDKPHIGHAYTNILCDTFARFHRFCGEHVFFLTGTDEHGEKIDRSARKQGLETKVFIDSIVPRFKELWKALDITYDYFIRTTDSDHKASVRHMISVLEKKGDIYKDEYSGWYCTPCESFWMSKQLIEQKCPDCRRDVTGIKEENFFFRMSKYQDWLKDYILSHDSFIQPAHHRNEVLGFLDQPLGDLCITRPRTRLNWGIPYPGSEDHVIYVWFDALTNYISAVGYGRDETKFKKLWPADLHMVGKDILRHHAVYWTIMLHALDLPEPRTIFAHGWWTLSGAKVSKSVGNIVDPLEVVKTYGVDGLRYYYLHEVTLGTDGAYSETLLTERYNKDLADELGNLIQRSLTMVHRYTEGKFPVFDEKKHNISSLQTASDGLADRLKARMEAFQVREAMEEIWLLVRLSNRFIEERKPWVLAKNPEKSEELKFVLASLLESLRIIAVALTSFLPHTARSIMAQLNISPNVNLKDLKQWRVFKPGSPVAKPTVLFQKIITEDGQHG